MADAVLTRPRRRSAPATPTVVDQTAMVDDAGDQYLFAPWYMPPRQFINPIIGLTPAYAVRLLLNAQYGYKADLQWTNAAIERKEPTLRALKERRQSAIKKLQWIIRPKNQSHTPGKKRQMDPAKQAEVDRQTEALTEVYDGIENFKAAIAHLALATFRGYAHLEKHVDADGWITKLEPVPQWYWAQTYPVRDWLFNAQALNINAGAAINPDAWVIREVDDPLDEIGIFVFLRKNLSRKSWDAFTEMFGIPSLFTQFQKDAVRPPDLNASLAIIEKIISAGRGALPPGVELTSTARLVGDSSHPFRPHLDYNDQELVIAGTGGKLTMLSDATGIGQGASGAHEAVFEDIALAEGEEICEVFRRQIDAPELKRRGFDRPLVEFALEVLAPEDKMQNAEILGAISAAGYRTSDEQASEMLEMEVHSVMGGPGGGGDMFEGGGEATPETPQGAPGEHNAETGGLRAGNRRYYDAPASQPAAAPFYEAERLHPGREEEAQQLDLLHRPYTPVGPTRSEANPDPPQIMATYPTAEGLDRYMATMRRALRRYQRAFAHGVHRDLAPLRDQIKAILALDKPELVAEKLAALKNELPEHLGRMLKDSAAAKALEEAITHSMKAGAMKR